MERRRHRSHTIPGPVGAVLLAGILVAGPLTAPAAAWSESVNPAPSPTTGYIDFNSESASWRIDGGPLKISPFIPPRPLGISPISSPVSLKRSPVPADVIGQHVTVTINLEMNTELNEPRVVERRTQVVHLLANRPTATVHPGGFRPDNIRLFENYRISYQVTWRWLTRSSAKPLPEPVRTVRVNPTDEADATCMASDLGTCTVDDQGWIRFGTTFSDR